MSENTYENFIAKIKAGHYNGHAGARRAVGRSDWSNKLKAEAEALIIKTFGDSDKETPAKKEKVTKKVAAAKSTPPKATKEKAPKEPLTRKNSPFAKHTKKMAASSAYAAEVRGDSSFADAVTQANEGVNSAYRALYGLGEAQRINPQLDLKLEAKLAAELMSHAVKGLHKAMFDVLADMSGGPAAEEVEEAPIPVTAPPPVTRALDQSLLNRLAAATAPSEI